MRRPSTRSRRAAHKAGFSHEEPSLTIETLRALALEQIPLPGGGFLYFSPHSLAILESDEVIGRLIEKSKSSKTIDKLIDSVSREYPREYVTSIMETLASLHGRGLVAKEGAVERVQEECPPLVRIIVANTSRCNLACRYCYNRFEETRESFAGERALTAPQLRKALGVLGELCADARHLELLFVGGEPLLRFDLVREAARERRRNPLLKDRTVRLFLITNGTLLTDEILDFCSEENIHVKISLDGDRALHDTQRVFPGGEGSYDAVVRKLPGYFARYRHPGKAVTATVDSFRTRLLPLVEHFITLGFRQIELTELYGHGGKTREQAEIRNPRECALPCGQGAPTELSRRKKEMALLNYREIAELLYFRIRSRQYVNIVPFHDPLRALHTRRPNRYPCRTGLDSIALFADGRFYPCHHFMGDGGFVSGDLRKGVDEGKRRSIRRDVAAREQCRGCWCRLLCGGECYHRSMVEGESLYSGFERGCFRRKALFREAILLYHRLREDDPRSLDWYLSVNLYP